MLAQCWTMPMQKQGRHPAGSSPLRWKWWGRHVAQWGPSTLAWGGTQRGDMALSPLPGLGTHTRGSPCSGTARWRRSPHRRCRVGHTGTAHQGHRTLRGDTRSATAPLSATTGDSTWSPPHDAHLGMALPAAGPPRTRASTYGGTNPNEAVRGAFTPKTPSTPPWCPCHLSQRRPLCPGAQALHVGCPSVSSKQTLVTLWR